MEVGPSVSVVITWATNFIWLVAVITDASVTASVLSPIQLAREALLSIGWWTGITCNCQWTGITCNSAGSITWIKLYKVDNIKGELGQFNFSCFPNLESFKIWSSNLSGSIPSEIGTLSKLLVPDLSDNNFLTGAIPPEIGSLRNLVSLYLSGNNLTGSIPSSLGRLTRLSNLNLSSNNLVGPIPSTIGHLTQIATLIIFSNRINGSIPSEIGNFKDFKVVNHSGNKQWRL